MGYKSWILPVRTFLGLLTTFFHSSHAPCRILNPIFVRCGIVNFSVEHWQSSTVKIEPSQSRTVNLERTLATIQLSQQELCQLILAQDSSKLEKNTSRYVLGTPNAREKTHASRKLGAQLGQPRTAQSASGVAQTQPTPAPHQ